MGLYVNSYDSASMLRWEVILKPYALRYRCRIGEMLPVFTGLWLSSNSAICKFHAILS